MAHKKGQGTSTNGRDSHSQRLGVKIYGGQSVLAEGSSSASGAPSCTPERTSAPAATGPSSL